MLAQGKRCLLLKEKRVPSLQSDLVGHLYREFDAYNIKETIRAEVRHWLTDLGIAKKTEERMLVYMSLGGTCRCAMAKVITQQLVQHLSLDFKIKIESVAHGHPSASEASFGARQTIQQMFGQDLLANHRVIKGHPTILQEADLILVMDHSLLKGLPLEKTFVLKPFLGLGGDVIDPWPDDQDAAAAERYAKCGAELKDIIETNIGKITQALRPHKI